MGDLMMKEELEKLVMLRHNSSSHSQSEKGRVIDKQASLDGWTGSIASNTATIIIATIAIGYHKIPEDSTTAFTLINDKDTIKPLSINYGRQTVLIKRALNGDCLALGGDIVLEVGSGHDLDQITI